MADRTLLPQAVTASRVVAVLRAPSASVLPDVVSALIENGITTIELTLTTPDALIALARLRASWGDRACIGMGTVTTTVQAQSSLDAGAQFLVTPITAPQIAHRAAFAKVPILMGAFTPTEVHAAWQHGAAAVKVFPASLAGPAYLRELAGPFPEIATMPSGGATIDDIPLWLEAGAVAVSLGGSLIGAAFSGDLTGLAHRARRAANLAAGAVGTL